MKKLLFFLLTVVLCSLTAAAQTKTVNGIVLDANSGEPLIGATINPIGASNGAATDIDGKFKLTVPVNVKEIKVTYVGYTPQTLPLREGMVVHLSSSTENLDDLVVVAYGTASKESLTGSVAVVNSQEIEKRPVASVTGALEGMAPGVQVNSSTGTPGSDPSIVIRGINTVNGTTAPLYVVDGVVWNGGISDLNPNDVENISVLKDAASCALYGSKGANGVVLITTKRTKKVGQADITVKVSQGMYQRGLAQYDRLGYDQWNETMLQAFSNGAYSAAYGGKKPITREKAMEQTLDSYFSTAGVLNLYERTAKEIEEYGKDENGRINWNTSGSGKGFFDKDGKVTRAMMPGYTDLDWWDAISRTGYRQEYNISGSGATEKFNMYASLGYLDEKGYLLNTDFQRWTGRLRAEVNPVKYLRIGMNLGGTSSSSDKAQFSSDNLSSTSNPFAYQTTAPGLPFYEHDWTTGAIVYGEDGMPVWNTMNGYAAFSSNKGYILRANSTDAQYLALDGNAFATVILPYGFDVTVRGTMNRWRRENTDYQSPAIGSAQGFGRLSKTFYNSYTYNFQQTVNWSQEYGMHHIDVMLNHENYSRAYEYSSVQNRDELFPDKLFLSNFTENESTGAYAFRYRTESYMGRARYNYEQKYFAEASINRDGTSRFSKDSRWGTFWSVGASWVLTKEKFMQNLTWVDFLKARLSYGTAGNDYTNGYYPYLDSWGLYGHTLNGHPSVYPNVIGNPDLHWEATKTLDVALETNLLNNRLNLSVGYFLRTNSDLIYDVSQAPSNGIDIDGYYRTITKNVGDMHNYGWEIALGGTIIRNSNVEWNAGIDATFIKNKITKLPAGNQWNSPRALIEGKSRYEWYMPKWAGTDMLTGRSLYEINPCHKWDSEVFDANGNSLGWQHDQAKFDSNLANAKSAGELVKIGDKYYTTNVSYASNEFCGTSLPTVYGSFNTSVRWKGLTAGLLFTYSLGGKTLDSTYSTLMSISAGGALHKDALNSWTLDMAEGIDENNPSRINPNINPEVNSTYSNQNNSSSSRWLTSSDYLALKNINVGYDLPRAWVNAMKMKNLNIGLSIDNVFIATKRKGMNPTYNNAGAQGNYFVAARVYSFELTAKF